MPQVRKNIQQNKSLPPTVHLDIPTRIPRSTVFDVAGWVVSNTEVLSVESGTASFALSRREDVEAAYPDIDFVHGFTGRLSCPNVDRQPMTITVKTINETSEHEFNLASNPMLSISKKEKFARFQSAFPSSDPQECLEY